MVSIPTENVTVVNQSLINTGCVKLRFFYAYLQSTASYCPTEVQRVPH